jgi:serine/threonine protein kinase
MLSCFRNPISNKKNKEGFFRRNGAAMLEHFIHDFNGKCNPIRMYSVKELSKATNDYKRDDQIHQHSDYKLYKGVHEGQQILVKMFERWPAQFSTLGRVELITNEIAIASNMSNHKNFLKLIGCCLETEVPTLVYDFPAKGNLSHHIYRESDHLLVWPTKLKIAIQVADAVAYLHYGKS